MQYYDKEKLFENIHYYPNKIEDLISADSYNEDDIVKSFNKIDKIGQSLLLRCSIHVALIGSGNKTYGSIRDNDDKVIEIYKIYDKYNILYNKKQSEKYDKGLLSARRLVRLLRYHIQKFILESQRPSFLWLKYSERDKNFIHICFPSGENLVENEIEAKYLINTYLALDKAQNTNFVKRLERVFIARGVLKPSYLIIT